MSNIFENDMCPDDVQTARRFVEKHDWRVVHQCTGKSYSLFLTGAERRTSLVDKSPKVKEIGQ